MRSGATKDLAPATSDITPLAAVRALAAVLETSDARELELETPRLRLLLRKAPYRRPRLPVQKAAPPAQNNRHHHQICAPLTGIWYDSLSPGTPPYVHVGSMVDVGTVIGLIETMKIFNEIMADAAGRVVEVHVHRGQLVARNAPLLAIDSTEVAPAWPRP